jgi:hypothetical protein
MELQILMNDLTPTLLEHRRRLPVFRGLTSDDSSDELCESRHLEVVGLDSTLELDELETLFGMFGHVQGIDTLHLASGLVVVTYFDSRAALKARDWLDRQYLVRSVPSPPVAEYSDQVQLLIESSAAEAVQGVLELFGEISSFEVEGSHISVKYFDLRVAAKATEALRQAAYQDTQFSSPSILKESAKFYENEFLDNPLSPPCQPAMSNDASTAPSPSISKPSSTDSSKAGNYEDIRKKLFKKKKEDQLAIDLKAVDRDEDLRTTVMVKNIPNKYSQHMMLQTLDKHLPGSYDFFYLPIDFKNKCNVGYAFVNFKSHRSILSFYSMFCDKRWEKFNSEKICALNYARIQGLAALESHFQNSSVMSHEDSKVKPLVFKSVV